MTAPHSSTVLVVNAGSSSVKYELVDITTGEHTARGSVAPIGEPEATLHHERPGSREVRQPVGVVSHAHAVGLVLDCFAAAGPSLEGVVGVGHRVVHGGARFTGPVVIDDDVTAEISRLVKLAPLHNQVALDCIAAVRERLPDVPQVAVFDTAFHATAPDAATAFALPGDVVRPHMLRRFGFHGTSVEYVVGRAARELGKDASDTNLVVCHLGNGASVTAVRQGRSVDSSMGFSPLGGLVMGTRSGDVDASVVLYLLDQVGMSATEVATLLNARSGLKGLTGDSDMRRVRARAERGEPEAVRAIAICTHRIRAYVGAALAHVPDLDALVFTGGIGENDAALRDEVCAPLAHLAIPRVLVVPTDEEQQIALHTIELVTSRRATTMSTTQPPQTAHGISADPSDRDVEALDAWWRANMYLTVGQIYLGANPLLREPLRVEHIKPRLLGHWGTSPGLALIYAHVSRLIRQTGQQAIYLAGPGHGGPALVAASWLEGSYTEIYPAITQDEEGMHRLFRQFSSPGGIPSHVSVTTPGSIHEGGELGYVLVHAFGAVMDNPDLIAVAVVGDGEAETGPLEGSWKGVSFLNPARDGAVLPILHLNDAKIGGPTVLGRKDPAEVRSLFSGHGYDVVEVEGDDLPGMHHRFAQALAGCWSRIRTIQEQARSGSWDGVRPRWPMIVLRSPKGWTGPRDVDGVHIEGTYRAHQVPLSGVRENPEHLAMLEAWLRSYRPEELFDATGRLTEPAASLTPVGDLRMSASPHANGGRITRDLVLPDHRGYAVDVPVHGAEQAESTRRLGRLLRDVYAANPDSFRLFCPDETNSNRLGDVFAVTDRAFMEATRADDVALSRDGRVMEVLSEHNCHGWLEGYTLTGRHGMFATYEAFAMVSASQTVQHSKWLEEALHLPWREKVPSLNVLLTSTAWRNDHNGFSHQGPGLIQVMITHRGEVARVYLPPDANCLLSVADHCLRSRSYVNLIVIDKQPQLQYLDMAAADAHCKAGAGVWQWAGTDDGTREPDVVLACAGDVVTMETVAAAQILRERVPNLSVRVVNVVDLMALVRPVDHPHGMDPTFFSELFTETTDVVFSFHGFPGAVHQLLHGRPDTDRFHVRGFIEQGTTTTPFDMTVLNKASRYHLVIDALNNARMTPVGAHALSEWCHAKLAEHSAYIREHLEDLPEITGWTLGESQASS